MSERKALKPVITVAVMMIITIAGKALALVRDRLQGTEFGADTIEGMAFLQASTLPRNFLDIMFAAAFSASFIPVFNGIMQKKSKEAAFNLAASFMTFVLLITTIITILMMIFAAPIFGITLGNDVPDGVFVLGTALFRIMLPLMIFSGLAFTFTGILQSLGEFRIPAAMSVLSNAIIILYYFFLVDSFGVRGLAGAFLLGWLLQVAVQLPFLIKHKFRFRLKLDFKDEGLRQILKMALPVMASTWVVPVNQLVNQRVASGLYDGEYGLVAIGFAHTLNLIIAGVFILSVSNLIFPKLSREAVLPDLTDFKMTINETVRILFFFLLPLTLGLMALSEPIIRVWLYGGAFDEMAVQITARALFYFSIGIMGFGMMTVLSRACYAKQDIKTPMIAAGIVIVLNAAMSISLAPLLEIAGPALAASVSQIIGALVMMFSLTKQNILVWNRILVADIIKMTAIAVIMVVVVVFVKNQLVGLNTFIYLIIPAVLGVVLYFALAFLLKLNETQFVLRMIRKK